MKDIYGDFASKNRLKIHQCLNVITPNKQDKLNKPDKPKRGGRMKGTNFRSLTITVIVAILCVVSMLGADEKESKIEPKLVYEKTFEDTIVDVIFDTTEMTIEEASNLGIKGLEGRMPTEIVKVKYPKVVIISDTANEYKGFTRTVKFLNKNGKVTKELTLEIPSQQCFVSPNKNLIAIRNISFPSSMYDELTIYNQEGTLMEEFKTKPLNFVIIADDGSFVVYGDKVGMLSGKGWINFYNTAGSLIKEREIPWLHKAVYMSNNKYILLLALGERLDNCPKSPSPTDLICFDRKGNEIWRYVLKSMSPYYLMNTQFTAPHDVIEFSLDSRKIFIRGFSEEKGKTTWIFDINGKLVEKREGW